ncbi:MAG: hypothetical protein NUV77_17115 [Thermoguttaceae bacterium]|jgi:hypothetical protein|nr:hypothetical protein [Thermoguttaceae bacterium]
MSSPSEPAKRLDGQHPIAGKDADASVPQELLESILERTDAASRTDDALDPQQRLALDGVVRRYRGQPLSLDPIATEMVRAMLTTEFRDRPEWAGAWDAVSGHVAQTLWEDQVSRDRLEALWLRLSEG